MYNPQLVIVFFSVEKNGTIFFLSPPFGCQVIQQGVLELHYNFRSES